MDANLHDLPPSKRYRLLQQQTQPKPIPGPNPISPSSLPAKKRKLPVFDENENLPPITPPTPFSLPAKKRIWAFRPDSSPTKSPSPYCLPTKKRAFRPNISPTKPALSPSPTKKRIWALSPDVSPTKSSLSPSPYSLPTKKRIRAFRPEVSPTKSLLRPKITPTKSSPLPPSHNSLPTKKRIRAFRPDTSPTKPVLSKIDLNVEYTPSPEKPRGAHKQDILQTFTTDADVEGEVVEGDGVLCAVCESTDGDPTDPIVFCDGCDLMVHSSCYGNPLIKGIPEGEWYCTPCSTSNGPHNKDPVNCCLCPVTGGAMKPTNDGRWAHIVCAVLVPEVFFVDPEGRDGIDCSKVPKKRWGEVCYLCRKRSGCAIECSEMKCPLSFHVTCGLKEDLCIELKEARRGCSSSGSGGIVAGFCKKHTEIWKKQQQTGKYKIVARDED